MPTLDLTNRKPPEELNKRLMPTNENLQQLFSGIDKIVIKNDGVYDDKAISDDVVLIITKSDDIQTLRVLMEIDEQNTGFYCMCLGDYAIELYYGNQIKATIGFHHGVSIRYQNWRGDAGLAKSDLLLHFLAKLGLTKPLEDRIKLKHRAEDNEIIAKKWLETAPICFSKYWTEMNDFNDFDEDYLTSLISDLNEEIPDKQKQILILLQTFGQTDDLWTAYAIYEEVPRKILTAFNISEIISAYLNSDKNYEIRKGLGRFLCSFDFKKIRKDYLEFITFEIIDDLEEHFRSSNEKQGIREIRQLKEQKAKANN